MINFTQLLPSRLDVALSLKLQISRNQATNLIKSNLVSVNGKIVSKPSFAINLNDMVNVEFADKKEQKNLYEVKFDIPIIYEDDDLLVLNKPPLVVVHQAPSVKEATLVEWLNQKGFMLSNLNGEVRAGIVHRLDKGTSGAIVVAKNNATHAHLSSQLSDKSMGRIYLALSDLPLKQNCIIDRPIGRNPSNRLKKAIVANGKDAKSAFVNLISQDNLNLIAAKLFTGRTHQIRVHLASINRHILGDNLYGFKSENDKIKRVMLHAYMLYFIHPRTNEPMEFIAPTWDDFNQIIYKKISKEILDEKIDPKFITSSFSDTSDWLRI
ncbi:RluA family pseudouridine synthase [Campylobacter sp. faydin G-105]|uniref:RluA family pseudouridine synthase n=1 Tax=Campylobacter anatolicus TaxID=2829105 RepID=UPI001B92C337|nr:RluA family pseudouridine synthase [Campylobacter anatolicus]MBR8462537.1 RluA family pseudouridine synthase [Campylobacter anatolicus]